MIKNIVFSFLFMCFFAVALRADDKVAHAADYIPEITLLHAVREGDLSTVLRILNDDTTFLNPNLRFGEDEDTVLMFALTVALQEFRRQERMLLYFAKTVGGLSVGSLSGWVGYELGKKLYDRDAQLLADMGPLLQGLDLRNPGAFFKPKLKAFGLEMGKHSLYFVAEAVLLAFLWESSSIGLKNLRKFLTAMGHYWRMSTRFTIIQELIAYPGVDLALKNAHDQTALDMIQDYRSDTESLGYFAELLEPIEQALQSRTQLIHDDMDVFTGEGNENIFGYGRSESDQEMGAN